MVSIKEKLVISYDGSPECTIPSNLVTKLEDGDQKISEAEAFLSGFSKSDLWRLFNEEPHLHS